MTHVARRTALELLVVALGFATSAALLSRTSRSVLHPDDTRLVRKLRALSNGPERVLRLGQRCLDATAARGAAELVHALFPEPLVRKRALSASSDELRQLLAVAVRSDYAHGRLDNAGGWLISRTEALLASLAASQMEGA